MGPNQNINQYSFDFDSIRFVSKNNFSKERQNRMKNDRVMPVNVMAQKWHLAYFGP